MKLEEMATIHHKETAYFHTPDIKKVTISANCHGQGSLTVPNRNIYTWGVMFAPCGRRQRRLQKHEENVKCLKFPSKLYLGIQ